MTRLLTCGYETGDVNESGTTSLGGAQMAVTVVSSTPTPRAGSYCLKIANATTVWATGTTGKTFSLPASKSDLWVRFAFYSHLGPGVIDMIPIAAMNDSAGTPQTSLVYSVASGLLTLNRATGTAIATSSSGFSQDSWHVIEWRTQILTTTTGTSEVWVDGTRVINFSGDNSGTSNLNVQQVLLGSNNNALAGTANQYMAYDDLAINDTVGTLNSGRAGDGRVILLTPNGAGSSTQFVRGGTDTGANFSQVNEIPPSLTQYVGSSTIGNRDLYTLADIPVAVASINCVEAVVLAQNSDAGGGSIALTIKSGATISEATAIPLGTSAGYVLSRWETDPNTSAAWTAVAVNALEAGSTVR